MKAGERGGWGGGRGRGPAGEKFKATQGGDKRTKALRPMRTGGESMTGATGGLEAKQPQVAWPMKKQQVLCETRDRKHPEGTTDDIKIHCFGD